MKIEIPTYGVVLENEVYSRKTSGLFSHEKERKEPTTELVSFSKYRMPATEEFLDYVVSHAKQLKETGGKRQKQNSLKEIFDKYLFLLDPIANGDKAVLRHFVDHYNKDSGLELLQPKRFYFSSIFADVPDTMLDEARALERKEGKGIYGVCLDRCGTNKWSLTIRLEDGKMPESSKLEELVREGVRTGYSLMVAGEFQDYGKIAELIKLFSESLKGRETYIIDASSIFLDEIANKTISRTGNCIEAISMARELPNLLKDIFSFGPGQDIKNEEE